MSLAYVLTAQNVDCENTVQHCYKRHYLSMAKQRMGKTQILCMRLVNEHLPKHKNEECALSYMLSESFYKQTITRVG